ncbi:hypothetical protein AOE01nite_02840 [Acetobacter oeni]|uniref:Uncharacterized protein n=1 Tax=Acetobacter oeni TaxID=304077 RepID=A0A511XGH8_9PROT|nr:hypothetical protein AA21952_0600 [Acetobacter oeni LMG 21952]GEN62060.1 hypothetical protein AOE01nite_02840 [Acetobacter oeni]
MFRREKRTIYVALEGKNIHPKHIVLRGCPPKSRSDRAQILSDNYGGGSVSLKSHKSEEIIARVSKVGTIPGVCACGDDPKPFKGHHMIDTQATAIRKT